VTGGPARSRLRNAPILLFRFGAGGFDMKVLELQPAKRVLWRVVDGPEDWIGTKIGWDIKQEHDWTIILFKHEGRKEPVEFMHHCSTKWGVFLLSLSRISKPGRAPPIPTISSSTAGNKDAPTDEEKR
jgi:hypothetical protein